MNLPGITILLTVAWCATALLHRHSAAVRHAIWTCGIVATLLFAPLRWIAPPSVVNRALPVIFTPTINVNGTGTDHIPDLAVIAIALWIFGAAVVALRLVISTRRLHRVMRESRFVESAGPISILTSAGIRGPVVAGILHPVILLPNDASAWTPSRRRAVLAHELAHIRRRDPLILLAAHLATIIYWFHPLCWLAAARIRIESEHACDDAALRIGLLPSGYAGHLLDVARAFNPQPAIPMATTSHLESRMKSILDPLVNRSLAARRTWLAASLLTAALVAPLTVFNLRAQQTPTRIQLGGNVQATKIIQKVMPVYPAEMKAQGVEGSVVLDVVISREGVPAELNVQSVTGGQDFVTASIDAVKQWRYQPTLLNGEPVEVGTTITVNFTLQR